MMATGGVARPEVTQDVAQPGAAMTGALEVGEQACHGWSGVPPWGSRPGLSKRCMSPGPQVVQRVHDDVDREVGQDFTAAGMELRQRLELPQMAQDACLRVTRSGA
jgi:hypothetical protein